MWIFLRPPRRAKSSLSQPGLKERFLARIGKLVDVLLHAGLDPALAGLDLAAEVRDVGLACAKNGPRPLAHLRHRTRSRDQQDDGGSQRFLRQHCGSSIRAELRRTIVLPSLLAQ